MAGEHGSLEHGGAEYTLHYFPFSLYSIMARFALKLGKQLNSDNAPRVELKFVNLHVHDNLSEEYLTTVNSRGQVRGCYHGGRCRVLDGRDMSFKALLTTASHLGAVIDIAIATRCTERQSKNRRMAVREAAGAGSSGAQERD